MLFVGHQLLSNNSGPDPPSKVDASLECDCSEDLVSSDFFFWTLSMKDMPGELISCGENNVGPVDDVAESTESSIKPETETSTPEDDDASDLNMSSHVIGVVLADDRTLESFKPNVSDNFHVLGVILLDSLDIVAEELRRVMCTQLPSLPGTFCILTKQGWPLLRQQEHKLNICHIINENNIVMIRKHFDRPRVGVLTTTGECIGFIFIDSHYNILQVRQAINEQLKDVKKHDYKFIERNGWPVTAHQENILSILDIIRLGYHICIQYSDKLIRLPPSEQVPTPSFPLIPPQHSKLDTKVKKPRKFESLRKRKDHLVAKPILISYVRAEAAQHALDLKEELAKSGFSVYLDVHEIKTGSDWQDALNYAVSNCQFFVPLITPMYGKTQWTNREVKLADVLGKNIIPISFLDQWPPECLAIQFASTQYIPWRPQEREHDKLGNEPKPPNPRIWNQTYIRRVCVEIAERCKTTPVKNERDYSSLTSMRKFKRKSYSRSYDLQSISMAAPCRSPVSSSEQKLVVISAHPKQKVLIHQLRIAFEAEGYDVWCSSDPQDSQELMVEESFPSNANSPRELTSIPEGNTVFGQTYNEIATIIADSKRGASLKLDSDSHSERRALTRMISQVSDISQVSSLTPDKMERLRTFQHKTDQAGVVVIVVSEAYTKSKTSQQQVFYCEHRKQVVLVKFDQSPLPSWFTMLMGNDMITNVHSSQFITTLKAQVKRVLNPLSSETPKDATAEAKIQCLVNFMQKSIPQTETCVYIAGSSKLQYSRSEEIAAAIGKELAKVRNITLCTGGFFGVPEIVAKTFYETTENNRDNLFLDSSSRDPVVHLLPLKDSKDFTSKARQNSDGSFEAVPYGKTVFAGDSVKERETAVARIFDTCIVIEGGPGAAHEVEEFIWNDHFVIPIISTGGAAGGQYGVPLKIFEAPPCVSENDWLVLSEKEAKPETVAKAVVNILVALKESIVTHINSQTSMPIDASKFKNKARTRSRKSKMPKEPDQIKALHLNKIDETVQIHGSNTNYNGIRGHRLLERQGASYTVNANYKYGSRWQRFLRIFSATKIR